VPLANYRRTDAVAVISFANPPLNSLSHGLRAGIVAGVDRAVADKEVAAIVLVGSGRAFSSGADIREFDTPLVTAEPTLPTVISIVENCTKPVIAAVSGACMGGGLELALGCHFRVATKDAKIAFPEVKLGLVPGAGGTQRFPRLVGLEHAVNLIASGATVPAAMFKGTALFDEFAAGDVDAAAVAFANKIIAAKQPIARVRDRKVVYPQSDAFLHFARSGAAAVARGMPAPMKCVDAVAASLTQSFDAGIATENAIFRELMGTPESKALRYAFFAERAASKIPDVPDSTPQRPIKHAAVIGAGTMGGGIAMNFANAGIPVWLLEVKQEALDRGVATIRKNYESTVKRGKLTPEQAEQRAALVKPTLEYQDIAGADLVIEAVFEDMGVKEKVFRQLDAVMKRGAILATNTSTLDVDKIASFTKRPKDVVGTHFFSPANVMKLLEVVRGRATGKDVLATVMGAAKTIGKTAVVSGVCDGFIGNRMIEQYSRQAMFLLEEGATPQQVDRAVETLGFAMGPFRMSDLAGNDIGWHIRKRRYVEQPKMKYSKLADQVCELGRFGQKTGAGWYRYEAGERDAIADPVIDELIARERAALGVKPRKIADAEIVDRLIYSLVNEGAHILAEGIAQRASDIDIVYLMGYGFPVYRGGPMFHAESQGLYNVVRRMREFARNPHGDPGFWQPAPLLVRAAEAGSFAAAATRIARPSTSNATRRKAAPARGKVAKRTVAAKRKPAHRKTNSNKSRRSRS
jgi:3-hydroxyacyl-CoA dehydrogenase